MEQERLAATLNLFPVGYQGVIEVCTPPLFASVTEIDIPCVDTEDFPEFNLPKTRDDCSPAEDMEICGGQGTSHF
jgi:hypothetical protein